MDSYASSFESGTSFFFVHVHCRRKYVKCTVFIYGLLFIARELINVKPGKRFLTPIHLLSVVGDFFMPPPLQVDIVVCSVSENENTNKYM